MTQWLLGASGASAVAALVVVAWLGRRHAERWGLVRGPILSPGTGPYRRGSVQSWRPRGVPAVVRFAAGAALTWGLVTLVIFVPAGLLLLLVLPPLGIVSMTLVLADGIALGVALIAAVHGTMACVKSPHRLRKLARWSVLHHAGVLVTMFVLSLLKPPKLGLLTLAVLPCLFGGVHAFALHRAARAVDTTQRATASWRRRIAPSYGIDSPHMLE